MKKVYIKPMTESAACFNDVQPLMHSDDYLGKDINIDTEDVDDSEYNQRMRNLWDD